MFKMKIWDVSQNVDRFKTGFGLMPCITPGGCDFASNRQDALNGSQTLVLQGMPLDKLHFAGETQRECQDLAGNAMSTTVIGASIISAMIHGNSAFLSRSLANKVEPELESASQVQNPLIASDAMEEHGCHPTAPESIDIARLLAEAKETSRMCACEGDQQLSERNIKICSGCGHTACATCASNPKHQYTSNLERAARKQTPCNFISAWRPRLPPRLRLQNVPDLKELLIESLGTRDNNEAYVRRIAEANLSSQQFILSDLIRCDNQWKVVYIGSNAKLVLMLGAQAQWLLYVDCLRGLPGNSELRQTLATPVARALVSRSLLDTSWEVFVPTKQKHSLHIRGSPARSKSWRNSLGLPNYQSETVPAHLYILGSDKDKVVYDGEYTHLPHCGTAEASLYKRLSGSMLYLFLDPNLIGEAKHDSFVFSPDCGRKRWGESRMITARLDPSWRPQQICDGNRRHYIAIECTGYWATIESINLVACMLSPTVSTLKSGSSITGPGFECMSASAIFNACFPEELPIKRLSDYSWALEQVKTTPLLNDWQSIDVDSRRSCSCAPAYPDLLWNVDKTGKATPHEDRKAAATFERGVKARCQIFQVRPVVTKGGTRVEVGLSLVSLAHRARGRLSRRMANARLIACEWRLLTDHTDTGSLRLSAFHLTSNANDAPFSGSLSLEHELRGAQPRALAWMRDQEAGKELKLTEVEEAVHPSLGWRAEARACTSVEIRGGVLADLPSFGKTVTTIALIQSEYEQLSPKAIIKQNRVAAKASPQLIDTAATLIVCPPHIAMQWQTELQLFLGDRQYKSFDVRVVRDFGELQKLALEDVRQSRVIVVSWNVLSDDEYISELAWVTAMPEPANSSCRAFNAWMDGISAELPAQVQNLQSMKLTEFKLATQDLLERRLQQPRFQAALPLKSQHGSKYQSFKALQGSREPTKCKVPAKRKSVRSNTHIVPLLHMFCFNRVVVDEYHYLHDYKKIKNIFTAASVKKISAHKRWILSGTPALANFTDVDNIASFLGVQLGRFAIGAGKRTALDNFLINDQTAVERFLSKTEVMSHQWHVARHERAQEFLTNFVRQNEASLDHVPCQEELRAVDLDVAHHAVYLELSQHLISQRMQVKRLKNKAESGKTSRLNASLNNSRTAEDALLKAALFYETAVGVSSLDMLVTKRSEQRCETEREIERMLGAFEWHKSKGFKDLKPTDPKKAAMEENTVPKLYNTLTQDIQKNAWLGDFEATQKARRLLKAASDTPKSGGLEELRGVSKDKMIKEAKIAMSQVRESCVELALRSWSERFIQTIQWLLDSLCDGLRESISCDSNTCPRTDKVSELYLASQCGHLSCQFCITSRGDDENCVASGCSCTVQAIHLIKATDLGSTRECTTAHNFGRKMNGIAQLIRDLPSNDQGLVFAPNDETIAMLAKVLEHHNIPYYTPSGVSSRQAAKIIEEFKASAHEDINDRPKVLLLNLASETTAGV